MKYLLTLLFTAALAASLCACRASDGSAETEAMTESEPAAGTETPLAPSPSEDFFIKELDDGTLSLAYRGSDSHAVFPAEVDGKVVTEAELARALDGWKSLVKVTLPDTVKRIPNMGFEGCESLEEIDLPASLEFIGCYAFKDCISLRHITVESDCIGEGGEIFSGAGLESVTLCEGVTAIGDYAFMNTPLRSVTLPSTVKTLGGYAFSQCDSLSSVTLNEGLETIGFLAFGYTDSLETLTVPSSVTSMEVLTFEKCPRLVSVTFLGDAPADFDPSEAPMGCSYTVYYREDAKGFTCPMWGAFEAKIIKE